MSKSPETLPKETIHIQISPYIGLNARALHPEAVSSAVTRSLHHRLGPCEHEHLFVKVELGGGPVFDHPQ